MAVAALHRATLPWTASSRAGSTAVQTLYQALAGDPLAVILLAGNADEGGFAAATLDLRATSAALRGALRSQPGVFLRLALQHLLAPWHLLAGRVFSRLLPHGTVGYVLTIGATSGSPVRGRVLLRALEATLEARGAREVWVDTERSNSVSLRFYARAGYEPAAQAYGQVLLRRSLDHPPR